MADGPIRSRRPTSHATSAARCRVRDARAALDVDDLVEAVRLARELRAVVRRGQGRPRAVRRGRSRGHRRAASTRASTCSPTSSCTTSRPPSTGPRGSSASLGVALPQPPRAAAASTCCAPVSRASTRAPQRAGLARADGARGHGAHERRRRARPHILPKRVAGARVEAGCGGIVCAGDRRREARQYGAAPASTRGARASVRAGVADARPGPRGRPRAQAARRRVPTCWCVGTAPSPVPPTRPGCGRGRPGRRGRRLTGVERPADRRRVAAVSLRAMATTSQLTPSSAAAALEKAGDARGGPGRAEGEAQDGLAHAAASCSTRPTATTIVGKMKVARRARVAARRRQGQGPPHHGGARHQRDPPRSGPRATSSARRCCRALPRLTADASDPLIIVVSGPGGVGKGTVGARACVERDPRSGCSRSWTTRARRPGEADDALPLRRPRRVRAPTRRAAGSSSGSRSSATSTARRWPDAAPTGTTSCSRSTSRAPRR